MFKSGTYIRMGSYDGLPRCMEVDAVENGLSVKLDQARINGHDSWSYPGCTTGMSYTFSWRYALSQVSRGDWKVITRAEFEELKYLYRDKMPDSRVRRIRYYQDLCRDCDVPYHLQVI